MKKWIVLFYVCLLTLLVSCKSYEPIETASTTATVPDSTITNADGTVSDVPAHLETNVVYSVNPELQMGLQTAQAVNSIANPTPFAPLINILLGGLSGSLALYAAYKNKQVTAGQTIVQAIESIDNPSVKSAISTFADSQGAGAAVNAFVQDSLTATPTVPQK